MKVLITILAFILTSSLIFCQSDTSNLSKYLETFQKAKSLSKSKIQEVKSENKNAIDKLTPLN